MRLVTLLLQRSQEGKLDWKSSFDDEEFQISFAARTLLIKRMVRSGSEIVDIRISITDDEGRIVDSFTDVDLDGHNDFDHPWFEKLSALHKLANRYSLGAEKAVNDILSHLEDDNIQF